MWLAVVLASFLPRDELAHEVDGEGVSFEDLEAELAFGVRAPSDSGQAPVRLQEADEPVSLDDSLEKEMAQNADENEVASKVSMDSLEQEMTHEAQTADAQEAVPEE